MSDLYAFTVGRNEEGRYLESFLENTAEWCDYHFFYDDQSDDETAYIASQYAETIVRPDGVCSFAENEGVFRGVAWRAFEDALHPQDGDWVFVIDCDEVVVADSRFNDLEVGPEREALLGLCDSIDVPYAVAFNEVFGHTAYGVPLVRMDGFWGQGFAPRLFVYHPGAVFASGKVGVPAVPSYVQQQSGRWRQTADISVMHYGYVTQTDRQTKYARYNGVQGHGHDHIQSILAKDMALVEWGGPVKEMLYGYC